MILLQAESMFNIGTAIMALLTLMAISLGVFLVIRFFFLWYWRVNEIVEYQQKQLIVLRRIEAELKRSNGVELTAEEKAKLFDSAV